MRKVNRLASGAGFAVDDVRILMPTRSWSAPEPVVAHRLVFVRRGLFRLRCSGWECLADPLIAYAGGPDDEQSIAHRPGREDVCTMVTLDAELAADVFGEPWSGPLPTTGRIDLAHRMLAARARSGADGFELAERVVRLAGSLRGSPTVLSTSPARRRLAESARELLATDPAHVRLDRLARMLHVSRSHLSRVFHTETGQTLTAFRNRVRVRAALDRIEAGETDLARLAADLGFADHAHLSRTVRAEVGHSPSRVRAMLSTNLQAAPLPGAR